ncbi:MAG: hypothetical protein H6662_11930 [Ardenticatenaceae bacterium]|nr:hypothetical protein [Anaerolineales bacterium]MCB8922284.1 hypothetical protein [Ardenticatenaceae bacterium]MCB8990531.1 hypothetical protein [Ardenticatenaceae bacterium]MCB9005663.1 hypothetical protein [Ardenticatenaceae bacterium]
MENIHMQSVIKAGAAAAGVAILLGLVSLIPFLGQVVAICLVCGGFLIPVGAGIAYGYFAPGEEDMTTSAIGGALSGGASGLILGVFSGLSSAVGTAFSSNIGDALASGTAATLLCVCGFGLSGLVFGAIGGVIWPMIQNQRK